MLVYLSTLLFCFGLSSVKWLFLTFLELISVRGTAVSLSPASTYVHENVHYVNLFCISFCTACYLAFANKMEWDGIYAALQVQNFFWIDRFCRFACCCDFGCSACSIASKRLDTGNSCRACNCHVPHGRGISVIPSGRFRSCDRVYRCPLALYKNASPLTPLPYCPPSDCQRLWFSIITQLARVINARIIIIITTVMRLARFVWHYVFLCTCLSFCACAGLLQKSSSHHPTSPKLSVVTGPTNRKN